jgi:hypothetical protein
VEALQAKGIRALEEDLKHNPDDKMLKRALKDERSRITSVAAKYVYGFGPPPPDLSPYALDPKAPKRGLLSEREWAYFFNTIKPADLKKLRRQQTENDILAAVFEGRAKSLARLDAKEDITEEFQDSTAEAWVFLEIIRKASSIICKSTCRNQRVDNAKQTITLSENVLDHSKTGELPTEILGKPQVTQDPVENKNIWIEKQHHLVYIPPNMDAERKLPVDGRICWPRTVDGPTCY